MESDRMLYYERVLGAQVISLERLSELQRMHEERTANLVLRGIGDDALRSWCMATHIEAVVKGVEDFWENRA